MHAYNVFVSSTKMFVTSTKRILSPHTKVYMYICTYTQGGNGSVRHKILEGGKYEYVSYDIVEECFKNQELSARLRLCYVEFAIAAFIDREAAEFGTDIENIWRIYVRAFVLFSMLHVMTGRAICENCYLTFLNRSGSLFLLIHASQYKTKQKISRCILLSCEELLMTS